MEIDLDETIRELLVTTVEAGENAYVVDNEGMVLLHYSRDHNFQQGSVGRDIGELVEAVRRFFSPDERADHFSDGHQTYALKVRIDPRHTDEYLGVVLTIEK